MRTATWWTLTVLMQGVILWFTFVGDGGEGSIVLQPAEPAAVIAIVLVCASVLLRTRAPWVFLAINTAMNFVIMLNPPIHFPGAGFLLALLFAAYAVAASVPPHVAVATGAVLLLLLVPTAVIVRQVHLLTIYPLTTTSTLAVAIAAGQISYSRRQLLDLADRRAREAEQTTEAQAAARVAENRLATARDLHDLVGHQIAVINLQANVASRALPDHPDEAQNSLTIIQQSAGTILADIGELLRDLREGRGESPSGKRGLSDLAELITKLGAGGLGIDIHLEHDFPTLREDVDEVVYRVLHEGLINAYKYGSHTSPATVRIGWDGAEITLVIVNYIDTKRPRDFSTSYGVLGIREQIRAFGGEVETHTRRGRFELRVWIPYEVNRR